MQNSSYFIENRALFGCYPKQSDVDELEREGVRYFVNLTCVGERKIIPYSLPSSCKELLFPIRDRSVPRDWKVFSSFISTLSDIIVNLPSTHKVYVHCRGGHGRAGMVVAILLCHILKLEPIESLRQTSIFHANRPNIKPKWKAIGSPNEYRQRAFVYRYFEPLNLYRIQYKGVYDNGFSRFSHHPFRVDGTVYNSVEGALLHFINESSLKMQNIDFTKMYGKEAFLIRRSLIPLNRLKIDETWVVELKRLFRLKLDQHPMLKNKLLRSGFRSITMHARGNFTWPSGHGTNVAGEVLMDIRSDLYKAYNLKETKT
jgi:predicted NAD-dependent protein-ADP-ribosyltransferase YbiA (DUF1768 family)